MLQKAEVLIQDLDENHSAATPVWRSTKQVLRQIRGGKSKRQNRTAKPTASFCVPVCFEHENAQAEVAAAVCVEICELYETSSRVYNRCLPICCPRNCVRGPVNKQMDAKQNAKQRVATA